jgi:hypothetical protein
MTVAKKAVKKRKRKTSDEGVKGTVLVRARG